MNDDRLIEGSTKPFTGITFDLQGGRMSDEIYRRLAAVEQDLRELERRSGLMSKSWINRIYTVWGYFLIAQVMIGLVVLFLGMIFGLLGS